MTVPSVTDWAWLGMQTLDDVARWGTQQSEPATWLKQAYAWVYARLEPDRRSKLPMPIANPRGPSPGMVPVLGATGAGTGRLGFVSVRCERTAHVPSAYDAERAAFRAAETVADVFRRLDPDLGQLHIELMTGDGGGTSVGLSAVIATLATLLSLTPRDDCAATGCLDEQGELTPVDPATLKQKAEAAERWGYRRLLVVEGQAGIPDNSGLQYVRIPCRLTYALFAILQHAIQSPAGALARMLAVFDQAVVRGDPRDQDLPRTLEVTRDFVMPGVPGLARHVAHDIRSRALLHAGRTEEAACEKRLADAARPGPMDFPSGWLGRYLKWQQVAHHAVLALDQGRWEDEQPEHRLLDRTLDRLLAAIADRQAGRDELLAALFLSNTRGRRLDFVGRRHRNSDLLARAWDDVIRFRSDWDALFENCRQTELGECDLHRQHNCCLDVLASHWHLKGHLPDAWSQIAQTFWPETSFGDVEQLGPFDLPNLLRWKAISAQGVSTDLVDRVLKAARIMFQNAHGGYPFFSVYEAILRYRLGDDAQQREAAEQLACSSLFSPDLPPTSILTLLALRAKRLLANADTSSPPVSAPQRGIRLRELADELLAEPSSLIDRCPY